MTVVDEDKPTLKSTEKNVIAGGVAGCLAKTITAPLSRLTVLYQVGPLIHSHSPHSSSVTRIGTSDSLSKTMMSIVRREGVLSLWRGNFTSAVIHRFPYSAIQFSSYEAMKTLITHHSDSSHDNPAIRFACGAASGAAACIACYPLDIVRTRLIVSASPAPSMFEGRKVRVASRIVDLLMQIVLNEGYRGLYRGLGATLAVTMPTMGISFAVYGQVKKVLMDMGGIFINKQSGHLSPYGALLSGSLSGIVSACVTFPGDVIRKRMQIMGAVLPASSPPVPSLPRKEGAADLRVSSARPTGPSAMNGMLHHAQDILRRDGVRGFYRGLMPEILKVCPTVAIMFCTYETIRDRLDDYM